MAGGKAIVLTGALWLVALASVQSSQRTPFERSAAGRQPAPDFQLSGNCLACHNSLITPSGEDVSIGSAWRASMMANSSRDPYWQASVRREIIDHPSSAEEIEDECSVCHMPMSRTLARAEGRRGRIFAHLPITRAADDTSRLAADGVSCTLCHQIGTERLGSRESFTGGYVVAGKSANDAQIFGPFEVDAGRSALMHSATGATPEAARHTQQSELCATCHTLFTNAVDSTGRVVGSLPEQVPFLEWKHSAFERERSCQDCHMPPVAEPSAAASVLGELRQDVSRHGFIGGNFFMLRMFNRYRQELAVEAQPAELDRSARATLSQLASDTAIVSVAAAEIAQRTLMADVVVRNLTGHKLPTGYPSRRVWLHVSVRDEAGRLVFESGAPAASGAIEGNDNDADPRRFEPHYLEIRRREEVQIYESIMVDALGTPTTGLLLGTRFVKDNRLLPRGFDKQSADKDIEVHGEAERDADFVAEGDRTRYAIELGSASGPFQLEIELRYQPVSFRWAENLKQYDAPEPRRFVSYYESMAAQSSAILSKSSITVVEK